jgi:hypothetical protein
MLLRFTTSTNIHVISSDAVVFLLFLLWDTYVHRYPRPFHCSRSRRPQASAVTLTDFMLLQCVSYFAHAVSLVFLSLQYFSDLEYDIGLLLLLLLNILLVM